MDNDRSKVCIGVGGESIRFLNFRIAESIVAKRNVDARYIAIDTDAATLMCAWAPTHIRIGEKCALGLGTNGNAELGQRAAEESQAQLSELFRRMRKIYLYAGLHGGTGLGATPVICTLAKAEGLHTTLFAVTNGDHLTEKEKSVLAEWKSLVDELRIVSTRFFQGIWL